MPVVAVLFFILVDLMLHLMEGPVERRTSVLAFDMGNNRMETIDFYQHFDITAEAIVAAAACLLEPCPP